MKKTFKKIGAIVGKINNSGVANAVDRFLEKPKRRWASSVLGSALANAAGGASAGGVLFGNGETLIQKVGDAVTAIPNMIYNWKHYAHLPEYIQKANATTEYLRAHGAETADSLGYAGRNLQIGTRLAQKGLDELRLGLDNFFPGGEGFNWKEGYNLIRDSHNSLTQATQRIEQGGNQLQETAGPVVEALKQVDLNPVMSALHNLADNVYTDEIAQTIGIAATSVAMGYMASQYVRGYWGRRGGPGILARKVHKHGLKRFRDFYVKHPEKIAGEEALEIFEDHYAQDPKKLERIVKKLKINEIDGGR